MTCQNSPMVTVLMPVYNAEKYIREAIESILAQTFTNFEFLIIDDGSIDNSVEIVRSYTDPRIKLVQNDGNFGITYSLNRGIRMSRSELIARMDADDISHPERLERQISYLEQFPDCALLATWVRRVSNGGKFEKVLGQHPELYFYAFLFTPAGFFHPTVMFKKNAVLEAGLYSKPYAEDFNLWCKMVKKCRFSVIPEPLLDYRSSATSLWRVTKKSEYEQAHDEQILENVKYYTEGTCKLTSCEVQFLRGSMEAILALNDKERIFAGFQKLEAITSCFLSHENTKKYNRIQLREVAFQYKIGLLMKLSKKLKLHELLGLLVRLKDWRALYQIIAMKLNRTQKSKRYSVSSVYGSSWVKTEVKN